MKIDMNLNTTTHRMQFLDPDYWRVFPTSSKCPRCDGSGVGYSERGSFNQPAYSEPCEDCEDGKVYSPRARKIRSYHTNLKGTK